MLTFNRLHEFNKQRCEDVFHPLFDWSYNDWMTALAGEVGEAANLLKKERRGEGLDLHELAMELADIQCYLDLLATRCGINLEEAVIEKFNKVSEKRGSNIKL